MTHLVNNNTLHLYSEGATLSNFIDKVRPTTMKPTFVALPSSTSHSTFYECSRGIHGQPQAFPHSPLMRLGVIISYSLCVEKRYHCHRHPLFAGTPQRNPHKRSRFTQPQGIKQPAKLVSVLPWPLSNRYKGYLYRCLHLCGDNLH